MKPFWTFLAPVLLAAAMSGVLAANAEELKEVRPGFLQGYLNEKDYPDSLALIPPPPSDGSARLAEDRAVSKRSLELQETPRFNLARQDANILFPEVTKTFSCALGVTIAKENAPVLYRMLRRVTTDAGLATYAAKKAYRRTRPFMENGAAVCTPEYEDELRVDPSYPSGHTSAGWAWALVLAEVAPDRADAILKRGKAYGESRIACNAHWASDVRGGRIVGSATVAILHSNGDFLADMVAAKAEYAKMKASPDAQAGTCTAENEALSHSLFDRN